MVNRDPHRFDLSPKGKRPWIERGWRIPSDLVYSDEKLDKAGLRIQQLETALRDIANNYDHEHSSKGPVRFGECNGDPGCRVCVAKNALGETLIGEKK